MTIVSTDLEEIGCPGVLNTGLSVNVGVLNVRQLDNSELSRVDPLTSGVLGDLKAVEQLVPSTCRDVS